MKIAFLTEMKFESTIPISHTNMRTEFAWMCKLKANHYNIYRYDKVSDYDVVFIIFPKGNLFITSVGTQISEGYTPTSKLLEERIVDKLKLKNQKVYIIQEGPHWLWNEYSVLDQVGFYTMLHSSDGIFAHNKSDIPYYRGMFPHLEVHTIPTLMIENLVENIKVIPTEKVLIGGNFARWYGGFESYVVASEFNLPIYSPKSHAMRPDEDIMSNLNHFDWLDWLHWMNNISSFKYAVHLMPTVAAGTCSLNCAYFGIPTIGNEKVDTQKILFPDLSVDVDNVQLAKEIALKLKNDSEFYIYCSNLSKENYKKYYSEDIWGVHMDNILKLDIKNE